MLILAVDTAHAPGLALCRSGKVLARKTFDAQDRRSEALHVLIAEALKEARVKAAQVEGLAVGLGPGSFTGLRIGVTAAATWAWAQEIPVFGFSRLEALGRIYFSENPSEKTVWVAENAGRSNVYAAQYARGASGKVIVKSPPRLLPASGRPPMPAPDAGRVAVELAVMAAEKGRRPANPKRLRPDYLYAKDCNVTLA